MEPGDHAGEHEDPAETEPTRLGPLTRRSALLGMGAVAGIAAVDVGGFAYAGGWLRPDALTPSGLPIASNMSTAAMTGFGATMPKASAPQGLSPAPERARPYAGQRSSSGAAFRCSADFRCPAACRIRPTNLTRSADWGCCSRRLTANSGGRR